MRLLPPIASTIVEPGPYRIAIGFENVTVLDRYRHVARFFRVEDEIEQAVRVRPTLPAAAPLVLLFELTDDALDLDGLVILSERQTRRSRLVLKRVQDAPFWLVISGTSVRVELDGSSVHPLSRTSGLRLLDSISAALNFPTYAYRHDLESLHMDGRTKFFLDILHDWDRSLTSVVATSDALEAEAKKRNHQSSAVERLLASTRG